MRAIGGAIRDLQDKRITLQRDFGSAIDSIRSARSRVEDAECKSPILCLIENEEGRKNENKYKRKEHVSHTYIYLGEVNRAEDRLREAKDDYDDCAWYEEVWMVSLVYIYH